MEIVMAKTKEFKSCIEVASQLQSEVVMDIDKDELCFIALDPANVAMTILKIKSAYAVEWNVKERASVGVNLSDLSRVLKRVNGEVVKLTIKKKRLCVTLLGDAERTYELPFIEDDDRRQKIPNLEEMKVITTMDSKSFNQQVTDADIIAPSLIMRSKPGVLEIAGENDETTYCATNKLQGIKTEQRSKYSIEYVKKMSDAFKMSPEVIIEYSRDYPLRLTYGIKDQIALQFILAPRVDDE